MSAAKAVNRPPHGTPDLERLFGDDEPRAEAYRKAAEGGEGTARNAEVFRMTRDRAKERTEHVRAAAPVSRTDELLMTLIEQNKILAQALTAAIGGKTNG